MWIEDFRASMVVIIRLSVPPPPQSASPMIHSYNKGQMRRKEWDRDEYLNEHLLIDWANDSSDN